MVYGTQPYIVTEIHLEFHRDLRNRVESVFLSIFHAPMIMGGKRWDDGVKASNHYGEINNLEKTIFTGDDAALPDDGIGTSDDETNSNSSTNSGTEQESTSPNMAQSRRVIKLDLAAMSQLLTFDEVRIGNFEQLQEILLRFF